jgi:hypothetical protein
MKEAWMGADNWRRRLVALLAATFAALFVTSLAAAPAQATYGPPNPIDIQLRSQDSYGNVYLVGRVVGNLYFDDGSSAYHLSLTLCRQSSYTTPHLHVLVNGVEHRFFSGSDGVARPGVCGDRWGQSLAIESGHSYAGVIQTLGFTIEGIHFDGSTARDIVRSRAYDNPYN